MGNRVEDRGRRTTKAPEWTHNTQWTLTKTELTEPTYWTHRNKIKMRALYINKKQNQLKAIY